MKEHGIEFEPQDDYLEEASLGGDDYDLIMVVKSAKGTKPLHVHPALQARQAEIRQRLVRGAEFMRAKRFADAEIEYQAAVRLAPQLANLHFSLSGMLLLMRDPEGAIAEHRKALRSNPKDDMAHNNLGTALDDQGDWGHAIEAAIERILKRGVRTAEIPSKNCPTTTARMGDLMAETAQVILKLANFRKR